MATHYTAPFREGSSIDIRTSQATIVQGFLSLGVSNDVTTVKRNGTFYANTEGSDNCPLFDVKVRKTTGAK